MLFNSYPSSRTNNLLRPLIYYVHRYSKQRQMDAKSSLQTKAVCVNNTIDFYTFLFQVAPQPSAGYLKPSFLKRLALPKPPAQALRPHRPALPQHKIQLPAAGGGVEPDAVGRKAVAHDGGGVAVGVGKAIGRHRRFGRYGVQIGRIG